MIFRKISYALAAQFMGFVFLLLLIAGSIFIAADMINRDRAVQMRMTRQIRPFIDRPDTFTSLPALPAFQRERMRVIDAGGNILFSGPVFESVPFEQSPRMMKIRTGDDSFDVMTVPVTRSGELVGYIQVADRSFPGDVSSRILLFLLISAGISGLTFGVGLFFARRSLKPAQEMMDRLEQFTQDASHELRTPLTAVSTSLDMALVTEKNEDYIRAAKKDLKEVSILIERLLSLAQLDAFALQTEKVDLRMIVDDVIGKHESFAKEKGITIKSTLASSVDIYGDPALIRQVVGNLLSNAIKFNKPKGTVEITLTADQFVIRDSGKGISADALPHIFDRFYQEDASRTKEKEGLGLGLALVKRIVDLHGWSIAAQSNAETGTTFTVYLKDKKKSPKL